MLCQPGAGSQQQSGQYEQEHDAAIAFEASDPA